MVVDDRWGSKRGIDRPWSIARERVSPACTSSYFWVLKDGGWEDGPVLGYMLKEECCEPWRLGE